MARILFVTTPNQFRLTADVRKNDYDEYEVRMYRMVAGRKTHMPNADCFEAELVDGCLTAIAQVHGVKSIPNHMLFSE